MLFTIMEQVNQQFSVCSFNCYGLKSSLSYIIDIAEQNDVTFLCEHWLQAKDMYTIKSIFSDNKMQCFLKSSIDPSVQLIGRPFGGVGFLCRNTTGTSYNAIECESDRLYGLQIFKKEVLVMCIIGVYLPYENGTNDQTELYIKTIDQLQSIIDNCGSVPTLIVGDMNTVLPQEESICDNWYTKKPYGKHSAILFDFLCQNHLCVANFMFKQDFTYTFKRGEVCSYIDHMFINEYASDMILKCKILSDYPDNVSDHMALCASLSISVQNDTRTNDKFSKCGTFPKANWHDVTYQKKYKSEISLQLEKIPLVDIDSVNDRDEALVFVNKLYQRLCYAMHISVKNCNDIFHDENNRGKKKHWWNRECKTTRDRNRLFHYIWKCSGRPKSGVIYDCYRGSRKAYRRCCRQAVHDKTNKHYSLINKLHGVKQKSKMWNIIRKTKKSNMSFDSISLEKLQMYFTEKFSTRGPTTICIEEAKKKVESKYQGIRDIYKNCKFVMSESQLCRYIKKLKTGTAPGWDGILAEHIKYAAQSSLILHLCNLFSVCVRYGIIPDAFCQGLLIPLLKKSTLDPTKPQNYRPITVSVINHGKLHIGAMSTPYSKPCAIWLHRMQGYKHGYRSGTRHRHTV